MIATILDPTRPRLAAEPPAALPVLPISAVPEPTAGAERARLARDLHDTVIQTLVAIGAQAAEVERLLQAGQTAPAGRGAGVLREMIAYGLDEAQRAILGLQPSALVGTDLPRALAAEVARVAAGAGLRHQFTLSGTAVPLPAAVEEGLFRIAQEALQNVRRHATAGSVQLRLEYDAGIRHVCLTVEDDGQGFDRRHPLAGEVPAGPDDPEAPALAGRFAGSIRPPEREVDLSGYGLLSMQERARLLGGEVHLSSGRGMGTVVEVEVPYGGGAAPEPLPVPASRPAARVRVVVADDHPLARAGVRRLLAADPEIEVVGEAADGGAALAEVAVLRPDVLLLDLQLGEMDGVAVLHALRAAEAAGELVPATVLLSTYDQDASLLAGLRAGARGFVPKQAEGVELVRAVRAAARGEALLPPATTARLLREWSTSQSDTGGEPLTPRECEVLRLLADGLGTKAIAGRLGLGAGTVKTHLEHLYQKLGTVGQGRGAAVTAARARGLI